ncbi:hypothetical protein LTR62_001946 [Meristemomyces frigidus]|uniref:t-SNARE affecting a late Golgi compartment protein 1 n=1 Tax=Meristemomyces frigidus TaxID=1508187 RepID=A0AAN7T7V3_9PEZI|nr:hypothetical protein LTR62_001946 [Meristemomyces frigidus]
MSQDPFLEAQADILTLLQQSRPLLQSYLRIRSSASSGNSPELAEARRELESTLTDLTTDLQDLVDSVKAVEEGDPSRYGLTRTEVQRRRKLVDDVASELEDMHVQLNQTIQTSDHQRRASLAHPDTYHLDDDEDPLAGHGREDGDDYGAWEEQRQMEIMHEQDEQLEGVFQTVGNLRLQADTMGRELEEQAELLDETEAITDRVSGKVGQGLKKIRFVIERNEGSHPLLQQTPLSVNPFLDLPKPPTLPPHYASLPSTLPPSLLNSTPAASAPDLPAYVTSSSGNFAAHPTAIIAQNKALLASIETQGKGARAEVQSWEDGIKERELAEKRRRAPGWLDSEQHLLQPEKKAGEQEKKAQEMNLMDDGVAEQVAELELGGGRRKSGDDQGAAMDRAFGVSEMG